MLLDDYAEAAMLTNHWPRVYTEPQVRRIVQDWHMLRKDHSHLSILELDGALDSLLESHTSPLNLIIYPMLGLAGEMGEVAEKLKKIIRDDEGEITEEHMDGLELELGDVGWYQAAMAVGIRRTLSSVARRNLEKLASRRARGVLNGSGDDR